MNNSLLTRQIAVVAAIGFLLTLIGPVYGDFIDLPVKWSQLPALDVGRDYASNHPSNITRADDFMCEDPLPIVAVRWWGSYLGENSVRPEQPGFWKPMDISFHFSDMQPHPNSLPVDPYRSLQTVLAQETWTGTFDANFEPVYEYNAYLVQPFDQTVGEEYFIDIDDPVEGNWGWHEAAWQQMDYQARTLGVAGPHIGPWFHDYDVDLAFELMVVPEPATWMLLLVGGFGLFTYAWRKRRAG